MHISELISISVPSLDDGNLDIRIFNTIKRLESTAFRNLHLYILAQDYSPESITKMTEICKNSPMRIFPTYISSSEINCFTELRIRCGKLVPTPLS
jgi:lipopolysaccharide biosynthesis glycosyltransferase